MADTVNSPSVAAANSADKPATTALSEVLVELDAAYAEIETLFTAHEMAFIGVAAFILGLVVRWVV